MDRNLRTRGGLASLLKLLQQGPSAAEAETYGASWTGTSGPEEASPLFLNLSSRALQRPIRSIPRQSICLPLIRHRHHKSSPS